MVNMLAMISSSRHLVKKAALNLVLLLFAAAAFAAEDRIRVASIQHEPPARSSRILPPAITEKYEYYEVCGCNEKELHCDLRQKCGTWTDGKKYDSLTSWDIKWEHEYDQVSKTCAVNSFKPIISFVFRYPKWKQPDDAPQALIDKWNHYLKNLIDHENGHRDMVVNTVHDLSLAVVQLPPASSCDDLDRDMRALFQKQMAKMNKDQREYDETTKHGTTQGAVFP